jgi:hypothetical protein
MNDPSRFDHQTDELSGGLCLDLFRLTERDPAAYVDALRRAAEYLNDEADDFERELSPPPPARRPS